MLSSKQFGKNVARLRVERSLTQLQLATEAELSRSSLQYIEKGRFYPSLAIVLRLKKALGCSWDVLMEGVE
ncbi:MAG: helix-turn-helix transcriptional regulator [Chthoniobacteraceae bacterium]